MKLKILSFSGESFSNDDTISATMMTGVGEITILSNHSPLLTSIKPGTILVVYKKNGLEKSEYFAVGSGVVEVSNNQVKIMADMLVDADSLDLEKAEKAKKDAISIMEKYKNSNDKIDMEKFIEAEDMLLKSIAQLKLSEK